MFYDYSTDITNYKEEIMSLEKRIKQLDNKADVAKSDDPDDSQKEIPTVTPSDEVNTVTPSVDVNDKLSKVKQKLDYVQSLLQAVTTNAGNILQSICQYLKAQNLINILDCKVIVLFDHVEGNHWRFLMLLNMHLLLNTNSNPDELCGYLYYDPYNSNSITVNHIDCIGTSINIAYSFQQMYTSSEWLDIKNKKEFGCFPT